MINQKKKIRIVFITGRGEKGADHDRTLIRERGR